LAKELAAYDEKVLSDTLSRPEPTRLWQDYFLIPVQVSSSNSTGDLRILSVGSEEILRARENGVRFTVSRPFSVLAANSGKVLYAGRLGLLGTTLILDHGMGLTTLYSHLSHTSPKVGETVHRGQVIGTTGRSGLATSNELYFQIRIHGVPVSPREWWDKRWVSEHIDEKIAYVLRSAP
jgi:murein DD-endopeptidase MepM/ murein hydrolase activator NlpD